MEHGAAPWRPCCVRTPGLLGDLGISLLARREAHEGRSGSRRRAGASIAATGRRCAPAGKAGRGPRQRSASRPDAAVIGRRVDVGDVELMPRVIVAGARNRLVGTRPGGVDAKALRRSGQVRVGDLKSNNGVSPSNVSAWGVGAGGHRQAALLTRGDDVQRRLRVVAVEEVRAAMVARGDDGVPGVPERGPRSRRSARASMP